MPGEQVRYGVKVISEVAKGMMNTVQEALNNIARSIGEIVFLKVQEGAPYHGCVDFWINFPEPALAETVLAELKDIDIEWFEIIKVELNEPEVA